MSSYRVRWTVGSAVLVGVTGVALAGYTGYEAFGARTALTEAASQVQVLRQKLIAGDVPSARRSLHAAQAATAEARSKTDGPRWWVARHLPGVGDDVGALRTVVDVADELADAVLPSVVRVGSTLTPDNLQRQSGQINLQPIIDVAPTASTVDQRMRAESTRLQAIDTSELMDRVGRPVADLQAAAQRAVAMTGRAALATRLLPPMLGSEGKRTYLLLFQNNAEVRATGGLPGALTTVTANRGRIKMVRQGAARDLGSYTKPALPLSRQETVLFETKMGIFPADANFTPDFPRTGQLVSAMWKRAQDETVDGVMSMDPVALSYLLEGTGPVEVPRAGQTLTADNVVRRVLSDIYLEQPDPDLQDAYFAQVARQVFAAVSTGQGDAQTTVEGVVRSAHERRLLLWSAHPKEQRAIVSGSIGGALPSGRSDGPQVGVYYNDSTGAKMHYYFHDAVSVRSTACADRRQDLRISIALRSDAPAKAPDLPLAVTGSGRHAPRGVTRTTVLVYLPAGGQLLNTRIDGGPSAVAELRHHGRPVVATTVDLKPGARRLLVLTALGGPGQIAAPRLQVTPTVWSAGSKPAAASAC